MKKLTNLGTLPKPLRMTFLSIGLVVLIGNILTGVDNVSWVLWLPPVLLPLAALTGVCPFKIFWEKIFK